MAETINCFVLPHRDKWIVKVIVNGTVEGYRIFRDEFSAYKFSNKHIT